jgi:NAD-reducing hydrogenase small subunit
MARVRLATVWLGGCSGCHMSFLDLDEALVDLSRAVEVVYSPLMDAKTYPEGVEVALVEGAIVNEENLEMLRQVRARTRCLVALGDCAITGNVPAMRNTLGSAREALAAAYGDAIPEAPGVLPRLLDRVQPLHAVVGVDVFVPGCPPSAPRIRAVLDDLLAGRPPARDPADIRFG